jgi:tRNA threonylcarbamoyladenosine biosynthesis protein TsaB
VGGKGSAAGAGSEPLVVVILIGIETATMQVGCAVGGAEGVFASFHSSRGRRHAETLTPAIELVCRQAQIGLREISAVAVDVGPGLYTGLRVGIATAKAMALALRVPMIGLSSLDLLAFRVRHTRRLIAAVVDARRGEVFYACYRQVPGGVQRLTEPVVASPADLASELMANGEETLVVGDGALRYAELLEKVSHVELGSAGDAWPTADSLIELGHPRAIREEFVQTWEIEPLYLRKADAEVNFETLTKDRR